MKQIHKNQLQNASVVQKNQQAILNLPGHSSAILFPQKTHDVSSHVKGREATYKVFFPTSYQWSFFFLNDLLRHDGDINPIPEVIRPFLQGFPGTTTIWG